MFGVKTTKFSVKNGWAKMLNFQPNQTSQQTLPHENQGESATEFIRHMWEKSTSDYNAEVEAEIADWTATNGFECKKIKT